MQRNVARYFQSLYDDVPVPYVFQEESLQVRLPKLFSRMILHSKRILQKWPYSALNDAVNELTEEVIEVTRELQAASVTQVTLLKWMSFDKGPFTLTVNVNVCFKFQHCVYGVVDVNTENGYRTHSLPLHFVTIASIIFRISKT